MLALAADFAADHALAARCASGDGVAHQTLFARARPPVRAVIARELGRGADELDDVIQDAFVAIFRSIRGYRGESALATWACAIAVRVARAHRKRRRPATSDPHELAALVDPGPGPARRVDAHLALARTYALLAELDPRLRAAFALAVEGRSLAEISAHTGASIVAVKTRLYRARRELARRAARDPDLADYVPPETTP